MTSIEYPTKAAGLLSKKQYATNAEIRFMMKLVTDLCRERTIWAVFFIGSFNVVSFAQHHLVVEWHQFVFHIHPKAEDQLDAIFEQGIKKILRDISLVCEQLAIQSLSQHIERFRIPVTNIRSSEYKRN